MCGRTPHQAEESHFWFIFNTARVLTHTESHTARTSSSECDGASARGILNIQSLMP